MRALNLIPVPETGTEDVVLDERGNVYTGTADGSIFRIRAGEERSERVGKMPGRPLGLELLGDGRLLVCDAHAGLLAFDPASGRVEVLVASVAGERIGFCNNAAVARDGTIYFSDSSRHHTLEHWKADFLQNTRSGRLLRRSPDGAVEVLLDGLAFANGVALAADESFVAVAETAARTVVRLWLSGPRAGQRDLLATALPGYPDNIARGSDGRIWVTIASPINALAEWIQRAPRPLRNAFTRLPEALHPEPTRTARVMAFNENGTLAHDHQCEAKRFHMVTGVREHGGRVWLGSLVESAVAYFDH
ncbi:MAG: SMP-30/gluconolactonase/LRE family protein [Myxococcaceae bacterium]